MADGSFWGDSSGLESLMIPVTAETLEAYWQTFRKIGPRHETVYRLTRMLGWTIDRDAMNRFLAPEQPHVIYYG